MEMAWRWLLLVTLMGIAVAMLMIADSAWIVAHRGLGVSAVLNPEGGSLSIECNGCTP